MAWIHEADVDEYENAEEYDYNEAIPYAENVIASRRRKFDNIDGEYFDAIVTLSKRVDCPRCPAKKGKVCMGTVMASTGYRAPCHKIRLRELQFSTPKVYSNLRFTMRSERWK